MCIWYIVAPARIGGPLKVLQHNVSAWLPMLLIELLAVVRNVQEPSVIANGHQYIPEAGHSELKMIF